MNKLVAGYGSAANPPHLGHMDAVAQLLDQVDEVRFIPAASHAFGKTLLPLETRLKLARMIVSDVFGPDPRVVVDGIEGELLVPGHPIYSLTLLRELAARYPQRTFILAVGPDNADPVTWQRFRNHQTIDRDFGRLVVAQRKAIRSTEIRACLASTEPQASPDLEVWLQKRVGDSLAHYLLSNPLYR